MALTRFYAVNDPSGLSSRPQPDVSKQEVGRGLQCPCHKGCLGQTQIAAQQARWGDDMRALITLDFNIMNLIAGVYILIF